MRELNLFLLNGRTTLDPLGEFTYDARNAKSVLDLVFTDRLLNAQLVVNHDYLTASDHAAVISSIYTPNILPPCPCP